MKYVEMTLEEAKKVAKKDAVVLVAVQDLEDNDCNAEFSKKIFAECNPILEEAKTIAKVCDDFANQLRVFSEKQSNPINYSPRGRLHTILLPKPESGYM